MAVNIDESVETIQGPSKSGTGILQNKMPAIHSIIYNSDNFSVYGIITDIVFLDEFLGCDAMHESGFRSMLELILTGLIGVSP